MNKYFTVWSMVRGRFSLKINEIASTLSDWTSVSAQSSGLFKSTSQLKIETKENENNKQGTCCGYIHFGYYFYYWSLKFHFYFFFYFNTIKNISRIVCSLKTEKKSIFIWVGSLQMKKIVFVLIFNFFFP